MELSQLVEQFTPEGVWAILSLLLIIYIFKAQEKRDIRQDEREEKYQEVILNLSDRLKDLNEIKKILQHVIK